MRTPLPSLPTSPRRSLLVTLSTVLSVLIIAAASAYAITADPASPVAEEPAPAAAMAPAPDVTTAAQPAPPAPVAEPPPAPAPPPPPPPPPPVTQPPAPQPPPAPAMTAEERGRAALAKISYPWQQLGYDVVFMGPRSGVRAMIRGQERRIEVYIRPGDSIDLIAFDIAHEIGHAVDFTNGTVERQARWRELRGIAADTPWYGCSGCPDLATPAGDFAEVFAYWQTGNAAPFASRMAGLPSQAQLAELVKLM